MGRLSPFYVKPVILQQGENAGERLPFLMRRATGLPVTLPTEWALLTRRTQVASSTLDGELRCVGHFEHLLLNEGLSLQDPFAFVDAFTPIWIQAVLRPWVGRDMSDKKVKAISVGPEHIRARLEVVGQYVDNVLRNAQRSMSVRTQAREILAFESARHDIQRALQEIMPTQSESPRDSWRPFGLSQTATATA